MLLNLVQERARDGAASGSVFGIKFIQQLAHDGSECGGQLVGHGALPLTLDDVLLLEQSLVVVRGAWSVYKLVSCNKLAISLFMATRAV